MRTLDLGSWHGLLTTLAGLALVTLIGFGVRLLTMATIQQRRERLNRQINERLRTLIAAYKVLGGSFTGNLAVDPAHLRDRARASAPAGGSALDLTTGSDRTRRIRDAVEAALSDIILLDTEAQVALAAAAAELAAGRPVHTHTGRFAARFRAAGARSRSGSHRRRHSRPGSGPPVERRHEGGSAARTTPGKWRRR